MSTIPTIAPSERVEAGTGTRARIDVSETSMEEVESFLRRNACRVHFERRGGRTDLVVVEE